MLVRFSHMMIYTNKHEESVSWYCDKLGYEIDYKAPGEYASLHHKVLGRLAIHMSTAETGGQGGLPYFLCDDINETVKAFRAIGIKVEEPTREGESPWFTDFFDNVGNRWGIEEV